MKQIGISHNGCPQCDAWTTKLVGHTKDGLQKLECDACEHSFTAPPPRSLAYLYKTEKVKYPQWNWSLGQRVESRAHENHVAATLGMVPSDQKTFNKGTPLKKRRGKTIAVTKR